MSFIVLVVCVAVIVRRRRSPLRRAFVVPVALAMLALMQTIFAFVGVIDLMRQVANVPDADKSTLLSAAMSEAMSSSFYGAIYGAVVIAIAVIVDRRLMKPAAR